MMSRARFAPPRCFRNATRTLTAGLLLASAAAAPSATIDWVGGDGAWEAGANWSGGTPPGAADYTRILFLGAVTASASGNSALELENQSSFTLAGGSLSVVGTLDTQGAVQVEGGAALSLGRLIVQSSGSFSATGATATVSVVQGIFSSGTFELADDVQVTAESFDNFATMHVAGGATLAANSMINHAAASVDISGTNSRLTINGNLTNAAVSEIRDGGELDTDSVDNTAGIDVSTAGRFTTGTLDNDGDVTVTGAGSAVTATGLVTNRERVELDGGASAMLAAVDNSGTFRVGSGTVDGDAFDNRAGGLLDARDGAALTLSATVLNAGTVQLASGASLRAAAYLQTAGSTEIAGGQLAAGPLFDIDVAGGALRGHGLLDGTLRVGPDGELTPGNATDPTGTFEIAADLALQGLFAVDLAGLGDHDLLDVAGTATLGGTLTVTLLGGFVPTLGDFFDIVLADALAGDFMAVVLPTLGNGLRLDSRIGAGFYRLEVVAAPVPLPGALALLASGLLALRPRRIRAA